MNIELIAEFVAQAAREFPTTQIDWKTANDPEQKYRCSVHMDFRSAEELVEEIKKYTFRDEIPPHRLALTINNNVLYYDDN